MKLRVTERGYFNYRVAGILIDQGRVLLHHPRHSHWALPGGHIEFLEESAGTLRREIKEELGVTVSVNRLHWVCEHTFCREQQVIHELAFYYELSLPAGHSLFSATGEIPSLEGDDLSFAWVPLTELDQLELYPAFLKTRLTSLPAQIEHLVTFCHEDADPEGSCK